MNNRDNHLAVNWIDGMKISKNHFIQSDNYFQDSIRLSRNIFLNDYNFGLLDNEQDPSNTFNLLFDYSNGTAEIILKSCHAITRGGAIIDIHHDNQVKSQLSISGNTKNEIKEWYLIISVNPFIRVPVGSPDINENPPRHPFTDSKYVLEVVPSVQINKQDIGLFKLPIGRINLVEGELILDKKLMPPCSTIHCYPEMNKAFEVSGTTFQSLYNFALKVLRKIQDKNKPLSIAKNIRLLCEGIMSFYGGNYFKLRNIIPQQPPVFYIESFSILAITYQTVLQTIPSEEKEELMKYTFEWCDISPGDFENILVAAVKIRYDHYAISDSVDKIQKFLDTLLVILTRMDSLEFVGQRKESMVVTKEIVVQQVEQPKKRWSILD